MRRCSRARWGATGVVVAVLLLSGCGSSSKSKPTASPTTTSAATSSSTSATVPTSPPLVTTKTDAKLGQVLADSQGMTLYTLTNNGKPVACTGNCSAVWPPLELPAGVTTPTGGPGVTQLGTAPGPGGTTLVTIRGLPLYRFSRDKDSGDAYGEGIQSFGGVWHVAKVEAAASPASTPPTNSSSGY